MIGLLTWGPPESGLARRAELTEVSLLHTRMCRAVIPRSPRTPEAALRRRMAAALRQLRRAGVRRVVPPEGPFWPELAAKFAMEVQTALPLRRELAAGLAARGLAVADIAPAEARAAIAADRLTGQVTRAVTELALRHRYVLADLPRGGPELAARLRRTCGVSLLLGPEEEQLDGAEALVLFDPRPSLRRENPVVVELYPGGAEVMPPLLLPPAVEEQLVPGCDRTAQVAALTELGVLPPGQVGLGQWDREALHA